MRLRLVVTLVIVFIICYSINSTTAGTKMHSNVDKREYIVLNLPDKALAADQLARLRIKLDKFIIYLGDGVGLLKTRYKAVLSESTPGSKFTSYTENKGSKIFMCIRERDENNRLVDENTLFFVALHELAHVMTISIGHTDEFWNNFKLLLKHAIKGGYYKYVPYHHSPKKYCGTYISDTPLKF